MMKILKIISCILLAIVLLFTGFCMINWNNTTNETTSNYIEEDMSTKAQVVCQNFVITQLTHPKTANFPLYAYVRHFKGQLYIVRGIASAKNAFGVEDDFSYYCKLKYLGGDWTLIQSWQCLEVKLDD